MKKAILLLVAILGIVSCGKSDDKSDDNSGSSGSSSGKFNPPTWIQGTWFDSQKIGGYEFKKNDFCLKTQSEALCFNTGIYVDQVSDVKEEKTDKVYKVEFMLSNTTKHSYEFRKVSDNQIQKVNFAGKVENTYTKL